ncbi:MAG: hypothetical protein Q9162_001801 [Coniocarpon cinnabarinum]
MSHEDLPDVVGVIAARLRELLQKARSSKSSTKIEPALSASDFAADVRNLAAASTGNSTAEADVEASKSINQTALETAAREIIYEKIGAVDVQEPDFVDVWNFLDLLQICADQGQCDAGLPLWLVEEMLDSQTIDGCRYILEYLKSRRTQLIGKELTRNKSNTILRTCNELLRRLSRAEDAVFCGDVFVFLFQMFPLGDKSAVNLRGEFHVENTTTFDPEPQPEPTQDISDGQQNDENAMQVDQNQQQSAEAGAEKPSPSTQGERDAAQERATDTSAAQTANVHGILKDSGKEGKPNEDTPDSRTLYPIFWSLQHVFSNPVTSFDTEALGGFKKGLEMTFAKFKATPKIPRVAGQSRKRKRGESDHDLANTFNPKYLTSRDLFDLELSDLTFQRHVLVQALIILDFLLSLTPEAKKKTESLKAQKSMIYNFTLSDDDTKWCRDTKRTISQYLQEGPDGKLYYRMVDNVLSRDKNWVAWKVESCHEITRPPVSFDEYMKSEEGVKRMCAPRRIKPQVMGSLNLDFLDEKNQDLGLDRLRDSARLQRPPTEELIREVQNIDLDLEMVDKETQPEEWSALMTKRASKTWRALRLERTKRLSKFTKLDEQKNFEDLLQPEEAPPTESEADLEPATKNGEVEAVVVHAENGVKEEETAGIIQDGDATKELVEPTEQPVEPSEDSPPQPMNTDEISAQESRAVTTTD